MKRLDLVSALARAVAVVVVAASCAPPPAAPAPPTLVGGEKIKANHEMGQLGAAQMPPDSQLGKAPDGMPSPHMAGHGGGAEAMSRSTIAPMAKDAVILRVDGEVFTKADLDRTMAQSAALAGVPPEMLDGEMRDAFEAPAYEKLIERNLLGKEAKKRNLWPSDDEAKKAIAEMVASLPKDKTLADVLKAMNTDEASFNKDVTADVAIGKLLKAMEAAMTPPPKEAIDKIYAANKAVFVVPDMAAAQHILIKADRSAGADVLKEREQAAKDIKALVVGKDAANFAKVAKEKTEDNATRGRGGDLGTFKKGDLPPELDKVAFGLKEGEIAGPILTDRGFHILRGGGVEKGRVVPEAEARKVIIDREKVKAFMAQVDEMTSSLRKAAKVERLVEPLPSPLVDPKEQGSKVPDWRANAKSAVKGMANPH